MPCFEAWHGSSEDRSARRDITKRQRGVYIFHNSYKIYGTMDKTNKAVKMWRVA